MKVATQNLILIVPIFLLLGLITSLLLFVTEQREVRWGLESEARGFAVAIAEFTSPATLAKLEDGSATAAEAAQVRVPIDRILAFGQARRIELLHVSSGGTRRVLDAGERAGEPAAIDQEMLRRLALGEDVSRRSAEAVGRLAAHAPIRDSTGTLRGVVSVETSLAPLTEHRARDLRRTAVILLALLVVGAVVSLALSTLITREIGRLTRTAQAFAAGNYDARLTAGPIEEVAEVGSTFGIMGSVLKDATRRSTREMLQFAHVSTETHIARRFAERFSPPVEGEYGGVRLAVDRLGPATHGDFWFVGAGDGGWRACLGRVEQPASFDAVLTASACATLLRDGLDRREGAADLLAQAGRIFRIHCCVLLEWSAGAPVVRHRLNGDGRVSSVTLDIAPGRTVAVTTLDENSDRKTVRYADAQAFDSPRTCVDELRSLFGGGTPGGVLVLQVAS